jgi:solute carrier family 25 (mitochondrial phosphate transporter), member 3
MLNDSSDDMPINFPPQNTLCEVFGSSTPFSRPKPRPAIREHPLQTPIFSAWSAVDRIKDKAGGLSNEAARELEKASSIAQQKAGAIELYSPKYYAACTIGGILACVSVALLFVGVPLIRSPRAQHIQL